MWLFLYEDIVKYGEIRISYRYPVKVNGKYIMDPSPIPRWDVPKLHMADNLFLFGAGREKEFMQSLPIRKWNLSHLKIILSALNHSQDVPVSAAAQPMPTWMRSLKTHRGRGVISVPTRIFAKRGDGNESSLGSQESLQTVRKRM